MSINAQDAKAVGKSRHDQLAADGDAETPEGRLWSRHTCASPAISPAKEYRRPGAGAMTLLVSLPSNRQIADEKSNKVAQLEQLQPPLKIDELVQSVKA